MALTQKQLSERKNFIGSSEAKIIADGSFSDWAKLISEKILRGSNLFQTLGLSILMRID